MMVGNPGTEGDWFYYRNEFAYINFLFSHALIPQSNYTVAQKVCKWNDFLEDCDGDWIHPGADCQNAVSAALTYVPDNIDLYGIYFPFCNEPSPTNGEFTDFSRYTSSWNSMQNTFLSHLSFSPCVENYLVTYLNLPAVQTAIHARPMKWNWLSDILTYGARYDSMVPLYQRFFRDAPELRVLVFSGDADGAVPYLSTQRWIECLKRPIVKDWRPWLHQKQVQGFVKDYAGLSMLTLKGCGHMVPFYCPEAAWVMFDRWIHQTPF